MGIILDLDQTIVDSSIALNQRSNRNWGKVYDLIPQFEVYPGMMDLIASFRYTGMNIAIVTSSPSVYCKKVVEHFEIPIDILVCYHDTRNHKPHPEPISRAIHLLGEDPSNVYSIGDAAKDIYATKRANAISIAATWGTMEEEALLNAGPDFVFSSPEEAIGFFRGL